MELLENTDSSWKKKWLENVKSVPHMLYLLQMFTLLQMALKFGPFLSSIPCLVQVLILKMRRGTNSCLEIWKKNATLAANVLLATNVTKNLALSSALFLI